MVGVEKKKHADESIRSMEGHQHHRFFCSTSPAPAEASARTIPCPIPWVDPVTRATRPARDIEAEKDGERAEKRRGEREGKGRGFFSKRKKKSEGAGREARPALTLNLEEQNNLGEKKKKNCVTRHLCVFFCCCCFSTMTNRAHSDAGTVAEIPHYGIR